MADVTISQFADVLKVPVDRLIAQLDQAGITVSSPQDMISEDAKLELLTHLRRAHGSGSEGSAPNRITLKRKTQSELRLSSNQGRARTVNVEVRRKRTYIKRDVLEGQSELATQHEALRLTLGAESPDGKGGTGTLILRWDGSHWTRVPSPAPGINSDLFAVAASSASNIWAVGIFSDGTSQNALAVHCC